MTHIWNGQFRPFNFCHIPPPHHKYCATHLFEGVFWTQLLSTHLFLRYRSILGYFIFILHFLYLKTSIWLGNGQFFYPNQSWFILTMLNLHTTFTACTRLYFNGFLSFEIQYIFPLISESEK